MNKQVTVRANGKAHPAIMISEDFFMIVCRCSGSKNGSLAKRAVVIAEGHEKCNCGNFTKHQEEEILEDDGLWEVEENWEERDMKIING